MVHEALLQEPRGDRVHCGLCPHSCVIAEGGRGVCGARGVVNGRLQALTYGLVSSAAADPIEKKPLFHFHPGSTVLSFGSVGCSMRCGHCQNWQISRPKGDDGSVGLRYVDPVDVPALVRQTASQGVAFTYNEPVIWLEWVLDAARAAKNAGYYTVMVTNGYVTPQGLDLFAEVIDAWRVDIKGFSEAAFKRLCHVRHPEAVLEQAIRAKHEKGMHVECVTNVVPTVNDADDELTHMAEWIARELGPETPWHVTRFTPYLEFADLPATPVSTLQRARDIGCKAGLLNIFIGNVFVPGGEDTICPNCGAIAVARRGFGVDALRIDEQGRCAECGQVLGIVVPEKTAQPASERGK